MVKFNFQGGKNQFPRLGSPPNKFYRRMPTNQMWVLLCYKSISTVVKFNLQGGENQFPRFGCPPNKFYHEYQPIKWECYCGKNQYPTWYKSILFFSRVTTVHFRTSYACTGGNWFLRGTVIFLPRWEIVLISSRQVQSLLKCHPALIFTM